METILFNWSRCVLGSPSFPLDPCEYVESLFYVALYVCEECCGGEKGISNFVASRTFKQVYWMCSE